MTREGAFTILWNCFALRGIFELIVHPVAEAEVYVFELAFFSAQGFRGEHQLEVFHERAHVAAEGCADRKPSRERHREILLAFRRNALRNIAGLPEPLEERENARKRAGEVRLPGGRRGRR